MSRRIIQTLSIFLMSLLLAIFFWAAATEAEDPTRTDTYGSPINIDIQGLAEDRVVYGVEDTRVWVGLRAPTSVWNDLRLDDIQATLDLSGVPTGTLEVPVEVRVDAEPVEVTEVSPRQIEVTVEELVEKEVPVSVSIQGTPAVGFRIVRGEYEVAPQSVRVRGPRSLVAEVVKAQVVVPVNDKQSDIRSDYQPTPLDADDNPLSEVEVAPKAVTVHVPIEPLGYLRDLAVTPALEGQPAPDYRVADIETHPPVVKVFGQPEAVKNTSGYLQTQPINLEGITRSITIPVALQMPEGLTIVEPPRPVVSVSLTIEVIRSGLTLEVTPTIRGLDDEMTATIGLDSVVVIINGPLSVMETLDPQENVRLVLDLTGLGPGEYSIVPEVTVPDQVVVENIIPEAIPVQIERRTEDEGTFE